MKYYLILPFLFFFCTNLLAQPANDNCSKAIVLPSERNYCSNDGQYTTVGASPSFSGSGNDVWFAFTPRYAYDLFITIYGSGNGGTLQSPTVAMFSDCTFNTGLLGSSNTSNNVTTFYVAGLKIGQTYYFNVSGANTGNFKLCYQNQNAAVKPGQDCNTARFLCSMETVRETDISGAGNDPDEASASCMHVGNTNSETNSAWFKWQAANNGTLVFTITPTVITDDLDWALFDLGTTGNCTAKVVVACANGSGVACSAAQGRYYLTGLDFNSPDISEDAGCIVGQDGKVKYIDMQKDHIYALIVNNPYSRGNGFTIDFTDQNGKAGTGKFVGPEALMSFLPKNECQPNQTFEFNSLSTGYSNLKWNFGEGASVQTASTAGPHIITYTTRGTKTAVLEATGASGCFTLATKTFNVGLIPDKPVLEVNKPDFCLMDTIRILTDSIPGLQYEWSGPNNYSSKHANLILPITSDADAGIYTLVVKDNDCISPSNSVTIPPIKRNPIAAFHTTPPLPVKLSSPVRVRFFNDSEEADSFLWDFGDGTTSTELNPAHTYDINGDYDVKLTAFKSDVCSTSLSRGTFVVREGNGLFIPNTFTPNGDGINDDFVITIVNLVAYHIKIFNRWGQPLFETNNIFDNWKGLHNGEPLPVGTYYYLINATDLNDNVIQKSGTITIIR